MRVRIVAAGLALAMGLAVQAGASSWTTHDPNEVVCSLPPLPTGSYIQPKKECHTRAEWAAIRQAKDDRFVHGSVDVSLSPDRTSAVIPGAP